jgi:hypothetical protein
MPSAVHVRGVAAYHQPHFPGHGRLWRQPLGCSGLGGQVMQQDALCLGVAKPPIFPLPFPFWTVDRTLSINKPREPLTQGHSMKGATLSRFLPRPPGDMDGGGIAAGRNTSGFPFDDGDCTFA